MYASSWFYGRPATLAYNAREAESSTTTAGNNCKAKTGNNPSSGTSTTTIAFPTIQVTYWLFLHLLHLWFHFSRIHAISIVPQEQVELCRKVAEQLVDEQNKRSKGANMFMRRVRRAPSWEVRSGSGGAGQLEQEATTGDEEAMRLKLRESLMTMASERRKPGISHLMVNGNASLSCPLS